MAGPPIVLCLDDYLPGLQVRRLILEHHGCKVLVACTPQHALTLAKEHHLDLALLDYDLCGSGCMVLTRQLRRASPNVRIALLSGSPISEIPVDLYADIDACIQKTTPPKQWIRELQDLLPRQQEHGAA